LQAVELQKNRECNHCYPAAATRIDSPLFPLLPAHSELPWRPRSPFLDNSRLPGHFSSLDEADETGRFAATLDDLKKRNDGLVNS